MRCATVTNPSLPVRPSFSETSRITDCRRAGWPIKSGFWKRMRAPANMRLGSSIGGIKPPRWGWPSRPSRDCGTRGRKKNHCHNGGNGDPGTNSVVVSSSVAAAACTGASAINSSVSSVRPIQSEYDALIGSPLPRVRSARQSHACRAAYQSVRRTGAGSRSALRPYARPESGRAGVMKSREHRVQGRATWVLFHHLSEGLIGAPANGRAIEGLLNLLERAFAEPRRQHRRDGLTSLEAVAFPGQVDVQQRFDHRELVDQAHRLTQRPPLSLSDRNNVDDSAIAGFEIASVCAIEVVAGGLPVLAVDLNFGDVTEMAHHGERNVGERQPDVLSLTRDSPMTFGRKNPHRRSHSCDCVPRRKDVVDRVDRLVAMSRAGDKRKPDRTVQRVIDCRAAVRITGHIHHDQVRAPLTQGFVAEPARSREVSQEDSAAFTRSGNQCGNEFPTLRAARVDGDRALPLIEARPIKTPAVASNGPTSCIESAFDRVETDHVRAHLSQSHPTEGCGDEGRAFNHAQTVKDLVHRRLRHYVVPPLSGA